MYALIPQFSLWCIRRPFALTARSPAYPALLYLTTVSFVTSRKGFLHCRVSESPAPNSSLAVQLTKRDKLLPQKGDLNKSITHLTEAVLLSFQPSQNIVYTFFQLASILLSHYVGYKQPEDIKSLTSRLVRALAVNLVLGSGDTMIQDMEEMVALFPEVLASDVSTPESLDTISAVADAVNEIEMSHRKHTQRVTERVVKILWEATVLNPDSHDVSYALASCLASRFQFRTTHVINDYEEAIAITDKIIATHSPGDGLTMTQRNAIGLIEVLVASRLNSYSSPEYLENAIHRFRTLLCLPSLPDQDRTDLAVCLDNYERQRFSYFGVTANSREAPSDGYRPYVLLQRLAPRQLELGVDLEDDPVFQMHSSGQSSYWPTMVFAEILFQAHQRTNRLDYLDEAITAHRDLRKSSAPKAIHFRVGEMLLLSVIARCNLFHRTQDFEEVMQLFPKVVNDGSAEVFRRFKISYGWAYTARINAHPSIFTAYETTMSLMLLKCVLLNVLKHALLRNDSARDPEPLEEGQLEEEPFGDDQVWAAVLAQEEQRHAEVMRQRAEYHGMSPSTDSRDKEEVKWILQDTQARMERLSLEPDERHLPGERSAYAWTELEE
ncbi:hypothetical protein BJY52DRAFT_1230918 [Lactarius psammicola]|nr:hypothetical protein BJY52DRAFT_1230918 [Lactarius psammicola]